MLQEAGSIKVVILRSIRHCSADGAARHDLIAHVLPLHRQRCQMPPRRSRHARAVGIDPLVTGGAREGGNAHACLTAHDIETMTVPVVALLRIVRGGVAVDAAWMGKDRIHLLPGGEAFGARYLSGGHASAGCDEGDRASADQEALTTVHALTVTLLGRLVL